MSFLQGQQAQDVFVSQEKRKIEKSMAKQKTGRFRRIFLFPGQGFRREVSQEAGQEFKAGAIFVPRLPMRYDKPV